MKNLILILIILICSFPAFSLEAELFKFNNNEKGKIVPATYYNVEKSQMSIKDWSNFSNIKMEIFNPSNISVVMYFSIQDDQSNDYWNQVNHVQSLSPGWNQLSLSLDQIVGERGSVKFNRKLSLSKIKKFFLIIDPDKKARLINENYSIGIIRLEKLVGLNKPKDLLAFDFSNTKQSVNNFINITSDTKSQDNSNFGFKEIKLFRNEDSKYAGNVLSTTIGITSGTFKVSLPNGKYEAELIIDQLGYWDVPFFKDRTIFINGHAVYKETRNTGKDFLAELLRFQNIIPTIDSDPYDIYLTKLFGKLRYKFIVTNGIVEFSFIGDETGISLNSLLIWPMKIEKEANAFIKDLDEQRRVAFKQMSRKISFLNPIHERARIATIVASTGELNPLKELKKISNSINFSLAKNEINSSLIELRNNLSDNNLLISIDEFKNAEQKTEKRIHVEFFEVINQFVSPDLNHETYFLSGRYIRELPSFKIKLKKQLSQYLVVKPKFDLKISPGIYHSIIHLSDVNISENIPVTIKIYPFTLPEINFPVGFMGLDPLPYSYYSGKGYKELRQKFRFLALEKMAEAGFTTFTGLPEINVSVNNGKLIFDSIELDETLNEISKYSQFKTIFSYVGQFPSKLLDEAYLPYDMKAENYHKQVSAKISKYFDNNSKIKIVHTFSDEAAGYNNKVINDINLGKKFKKFYPYINLAGFGHIDSSKDIQQLNNLFDYGFYSNMNKDFSSINKSWGLYNQSQGSLDDPRYTMGLGLYTARIAGLSHYLEWNSAGFNNYPYYDLDGRESDIVNFYPNTNGKLYNSIRFELARDGLNLYRKLVLLEQLIANNQGSSKDRNNAIMWLTNVKADYEFFKQLKPKSSSQWNYYDFKQKLEEIIDSLYK